MAQESIADALQRNKLKVYAAVDAAVKKEITDLGGTPTVMEAHLQEKKKGPPQQDCIAALDQLGNASAVYITSKVDTISQNVHPPAPQASSWRHWLYWPWPVG